VSCLYLETSSNSSLSFEATITSATAFLYGCLRYAVNQEVGSFGLSFESDSEFLYQPRLERNQARRDRLDELSAVRLPFRMCVRVTIRKITPRRRWIFVRVGLAAGFGLNIPTLYRWRLSTGNR
jgi:hypothetical protein